MRRLVAAAATALLITSCRSSSQSAGLDDVQQIAQDAYLYGLQQVIFYGQRWTSTQNDDPDNTVYTGINRFSFVRTKITPDFPIVTPNATTLYGSAYLDLRAEPLVLEMPEITDRYFSAQVMDQYGIFHTMVGNQFNGTRARTYVFVPVSYTGKLPGELVTTDVIRSPSNIGYCFVRIAVTTGTEQEIRKINGWQDAITLTPLSAWIANGRQGVSPDETEVVRGDYTEYGRIAEIAKGQVDQQTAEDFFSILHLVLNDDTMTPMADSLEETRMLRRLETVGIGRGLEFEWGGLDGATRDALREGFKAGFDQVRAALQSGLVDMNGWMEVRNSGGFETNWLDRAVMADAGWAGPDRNVSHTGAFLFVDADGDPLDGGARYTLTFDMNDLPPVSQFWSVPIYDKDGYFVRNAIDRYTINSFMLDQGELHVDNDELVIYIQREEPEQPTHKQNWLPAPEGAFRFTARFYGPTMAIVDGSYRMPRPVKVP